MIRRMLGTKREKSDRKMEKTAKRETSQICVTFHRTPLTSSR